MRIREIKYVPQVAGGGLPWTYTSQGYSQKTNMYVFFVHSVTMSNISSICLRKTSEYAPTSLQSVGRVLWGDGNRINEIHFQSLPGLHLLPCGVCCGKSGPPLCCCLFQSKINRISGDQSVLLLLPPLRPGT